MSEKFLYLTTTGRVTGKPHKIEIWYVKHGGCYYLCAEHREQSDWVKNIMHNPAVKFYVAERGKNIEPQAGKATPANDEAVINAVTQKFDQKYNWSNGLIVRICKY